jgi:transcription elongation factor Elf1
MVVVQRLSYKSFHIGFRCSSCGHVEILSSTMGDIEEDGFDIICICGLRFEYDGVFTRHRGVVAVIMPPSFTTCPEERVRK